MHHHRILFDKYHPGYFGKVGMRYFHKLRNKLHCPIVNIDKLWSLIPQKVKDRASEYSDVPRRREGREGTEEEKETLPELLRDWPRRERETEKERGTETDKDRGAPRRAERRNTKTNLSRRTETNRIEKGRRRTESRRKEVERKANRERKETEQKASQGERERRRKERKRRREGKWLATEQRASRGEEEEEVNALFGALETELNRG